MRCELILKVFYCLQWIMKADAFLKSLKFWKKSEPGVWGPWSEWSENCSKTCGIGFRRRTRVCSYKGDKRSKRCKGNAGDLKNCDTKLTCPVDGGWSKWESGGDCSVSCGGGAGTRKRSCTNPEPVFGGKICNGTAEEYGACNEHKCPDQVFTLSPITLQLLMSTMKEAPLSYEERANTTVRIPCKPELASKIFEEYPGSVLLWTKDGKLLKLSQDRMRISLSSLTIVALKHSDSGVYTCSMRYAPSVVKIVALASIAVIPSSPNFMVHEGEKASFVCNGYHLIRIFDKVSFSWFCNGTEMISSRNLTSPREDSYRVQNVSSNMTGVWICKVTDKSTGRSWSTNSIYVKVLPPKPIFGMDKILMIVGGVIVLTIILITCFACKIHTAKRRFRYDLALFEVFYDYDDSENSESSFEDY